MIKDIITINAGDWSADICPRLGGNVIKLTYKGDEAMKMEIEVKAPKAGTVQSILVAAGDKVVNGTPLVVLG